MLTPTPTPRRTEAERAAWLADFHLRCKAHEIANRRPLPRSRKRLFEHRWRRAGARRFARKMQSSFGLGPL